MRIVSSTPETLVVKTAPWFLAGILALFTIALLFVLVEKHDEASPLAVFVMISMTAVVAGFAVATARWTTVTLSKAAGRIEFETAALIGGGRRAFALRHLIEARADALSDSDGKSSRLLFVFSDAMAAEIDPIERQKIELLRRRGLRRATPTEIPLTIYYSSGDAAERLAAEINAWMKSALAG